MSDDLRELILDLEREATLTPQEVRSVVTRGAMNVKKDWRQRATGIKHARRYPASISFDVDRLDNGYQAVIGPEDTEQNQGFLGHVLEFGGAHNAPRNDGGQALDAEAPRFEQAIAEVAGKRIT
jgi:hypothetical protein